MVEEVEKPIEEQTEAGIAADSVEEVDVEAAKNLLAQGKRNLLCGQVQQAVTQLQEAAKQLSRKYGETADELGEAYLCYGGALLELARMESGVLGNALDGIEGEDDEEKLEEDKDEEKTTAEGEKKEDGENTGEESEELNTEEEGEGEEGTEEEEEGEDGNTSQDDEEVTNLQLAWEILELAKIIFTKCLTDEGKLKLADTLLKLGEVGLETESYEQALGDLNECLRIQRDVLDASDRRLAETHYQLGLAELNCYKYEESAKNLKDSVAVLQTRLAKDKVLIEEAGDKAADVVDPEDPVFKAKKEVTELEAIIHDIRAKLEDVEEEKRNAKLTKEMVKDVLQSQVGSSSSTGFGESSSSANMASTSTSKTDDITHLVRKKRKPEEEVSSPTKTEESKKPRLSTDDVASNGHSNGTSDKPVVNGDSKMDVSSPVKSSPAKKVEVGGGDAASV